MQIPNDANTTNTWRVCICVVPTTFNSESDRIWVGSQKSWGYIGGPGGKCFNSDVIGVLLNFPAKTIEFFKNGIPQGIAFDNLVGPVHAAVSLTGT